MTAPYVVLALDAILPTDCDLRPALKAVYIALRSFSNFDYEPVYPTIQQIADRAGLNKRTTINAVWELHDTGLIEVISKGYDKRRNLYKFKRFDHRKNTNLTSESRTTLPVYMSHFTGESYTPVNLGSSLYKKKNYREEPQSVTLTHESNPQKGSAEDYNELHRLRRSVS